MIKIQLLRRRQFRARDTFQTYCSTLWRCATQFHDDKFDVGSRRGAGFVKHHVHRTEPHARWLEAQILSLIHI